MSELCINDVSLRDGIQSEPGFLDFPTRLRIVEALVAAGVRHLQVASFVNPLRVPQMRDIESFVAELPQDESVVYSGLLLNLKGLDRLKQTQLKQVDISLSCSDAHSRKNVGMGLIEAKAQVMAMIAQAKQAKLSVRVGLQCAFGCPYQGAVPLAGVAALGRELSLAGCDVIALADSTGEALPTSIILAIETFQDLTDCRLVLHLHDTYGLGMANFIAAYNAGVRSFDAALGGVGGCPFIPGAAGNLAIEDVLQFLHRMGVPTAISLAKIIQATDILEAALDYPLPGKVYRTLRPSTTSWRKRELNFGADCRSKNS